nr:immunoglobulin light chain junction region [Macaca mulatta]MPO02975.1 immunoglobulin light chain junction region [Macaca mulatta]MPO02987.1 immunoglobulin light chain junction region [Macaca mulatta]MPO03065.1 immunoglobulin light chain junction region [Macaca mulatta]MPO03131.1 immunoglobulin light chain junction region [Macaca mulatta]
CMIWHNNVVLF